MTENKPALNVLLIHNRYRQHGGEEVAVEHGEHILRSAGHQVRRLEADSGMLAPGLPGQLAAAASMLHSQESARRLERLLDGWNVDVAHVHNIYPLLSPSVLAVLARREIPVVMSLHNYRLLAPCGTLSRNGQVCIECTGGNYLHMVRHRCRGTFAESLAYAAIQSLHRQLSMVASRVDVFLSPSRFLAELLADRVLPRERIVFLSNPIGPAERIVWEPPKYLLFTGRLSEEKGVDVLVDAAERIPSVPLVLAGTGPLGSAVAARIAQRGLAHVRMLGQVTPAEGRRLLAGAAGVVVPSIWYENCPYSVLEALWAGKPVIASDLGALPELVEEGVCGYLVPPGDPVALADAMARVWNMPHDRAQAMGVAATQRARSIGGPGEYLAAIETIYRSLCR